MFQPKFDEKTRDKVYAKSGGKCWYCGFSFSRKYDRKNEPLAGAFTVDHVIPMIRGGSDEIENLVPACFSCNGIKKARTLEDFREIMTNKENNAPRFSDEQKEYLLERGVILPYLTPHIFYFEKMELIA